MKELNVRIVAAPPCDAALIEEIKAGFVSMFGRNVGFTVEQDSSLLGGFVAYADGRIYDASVRTRLSDIKAKIIGSDKN